MAKISRAAYADMYGPTTGDKVRLADTELFIEVENDLTTYCLLYTSPSPRDLSTSRMPSSA